MRFCESVLNIERMFLEKRPLLASWLLLLATFFWGSSFISMKALVMVQQKLDPGANSWFLSALSLIFRFGVSAAFLAFWKFSNLLHLTKNDLFEGGMLGLISGVALIFQMDGVNYAPASTAAFLTQCYCVIIPLLVAFRKREWPSWTIALCTVMVLGGVIVLSEIDRNYRTLKFGRGELETLMASFLFTGQILWLERPAFSKGNSHNLSFVMFVVIALMFVPMTLLTGSLKSIPQVYGAPGAIVFSLLLTIFCTLLANCLMNYWQPHVNATQAGLIYCSEPVFTSIFALFLPGMYSAFANIPYANETFLPRQWLGGGLITAANVLIIVQAARMAPKKVEKEVPVVAAAGV